MIKCTCGDRKCKAIIRFDIVSKAITVEGNEGHTDQLFYLSPDMIVKFIHELKRMLGYMVDNP